MIRLRMSAKDAHYGGNLVDGAHMVHLFGDVATELLIMHDGVFLWPMTMWSFWLRYMPATISKLSVKS